MIGTIINAVVAAGVTYWILAGKEITITDPLGFVLFIVLLNSFEIARLHYLVKKK